MSSLQKFLETHTIKSYQRGDVIVQQDMEPTCAYAIKKGIIKTYNLTAKGEEKPVGFGTKKELFPLSWIFDKIHKAQYFYEALSDCELYAVPKTQLVEFIKNNPRAMFQLLDRCVWEAMTNEMRINALGQSKASDKVLHIIHYLSLCFGRDLQTNIVEIPLPLTQQDIANFTGLTRETISVELKKLATQKIMFSRNRSYVVLTDRLNRLLDDEYEHQLIR